MSVMQNNTIVVLISGTGTNLQALIDSQKKYKYQIVAVISNNPKALGIAIAKKHGINNFVVDHRKYQTRELFELAMSEIINSYNPALVVLAGFMRILEPQFISQFNNRLINIHPSLLPKYKGLNTHKRVLRNKDKQHGCTAHLVIPELDCGSNIVQATLDIQEQETEDSLNTRVKKMEYIIYAWCVKMLIQKRITINNKTIFLDSKKLPITGYTVTELSLHTIDDI
jgi:phosphoribosylglycinamide formyltransferase-1